ncbi:EcsC family protein [Psychrobacter arenosus]|uniref:EcsC family protein n=1 Tax=Psychrobacter arenosus TaxID=256326 RepID=UPI001919327D|nr:EcsC family protein [Psychrobacter arenosus]
MAKRSALSQGLGIASKMTRNNLERVGSFIDSVNTKSSNPRKFQAVDLSAAAQKQDLLREQTLKASQQLLGKRFATYGKYAKKVVPDSVFKQVTDGAFAQVAKLAANWSDLDLKDGTDITALNDTERYALATDIANQNRALATLGGITGLAGLPGMLADTLWLLLVSLRTIYQTAAVYDQPLTGKQGAQIAYSLLSNADLSKMQEKQALLAGLGVAKGLISSADNQGLRNELKNVGASNQSVTYYVEQVDKIASQFNFDIDSLSLGWLTKVLPVTSVAIGMHYNSHLIEEVIGVAQATFSQDDSNAKRLIADDSAKNADKDAADKKDSAAKEDQTQEDSAKSAATDKAESAKAKQEETKPEESKDSSAKATDVKETDAKETEAKAKDAKDTDAKGTDSKDTDSKETTSKDSDANKTDAKATASKKADTAKDSKAANKSTDK